MRLLDRILYDGFEEVGLGVNKPAMLKHVSQAQLIVADNVAEYYLSHIGHEDPITVSDFPNVMPPFQFTFLEMRYPGFSELKQGGYEEGGVLFVVDERKKWEEYGWFDTEDKRKLFYQPQVTYCLTGHVFIKLRGRLPRLYGYFVLPVDSQGQLVSSNTDIQFFFHFPMSFLDITEAERMEFINGTLMGRLALPACLALSFMHCKNVKMVEEIPSAKLSKKRERKGGKPLLRYHVLKIDHMKSVLEHEGHASTEGLKKALHICRGHFATYGQDGKGKLFGKHAGRYWIPMHMRGDIKHGMVDKTYDVR